MPTGKGRSSDSSNRYPWSMVINSTDVSYVFIKTGQWCTRALGGKVTGKLISHSAEYTLVVRMSVVVVDHKRTIPSMHLIMRTNDQVIQTVK